MLNFLKRAVKPLCLLLFFYFNSGAKTQNKFIFSQNCFHAAEYIKILKLEKARAFLEAEKKSNPENVTADYLEDYIDYYYLMACMDVKELHRLEKNKDVRLSRIKNSEKNSPSYLYAQAEINLHWAFARLLNNEFVNAAFEFRSAYQLLKENEKKFPSFLPNKKSMGMLKALLGTAPDNYQWILNVIGMKGNYPEGLKDIKYFLDQKNTSSEMLLENQSAEFYYTLLLLNFGEKKDCWKFCESVTSDYQANLWSACLRAFIGIKCAHNEEAISACLMCPTGTDFPNVYFMDYLTGVAKLNRLDKDADHYFKKFVTFFKGQNLVKDAYKRLSWSSILVKDTMKYQTYLGLARKYGAVVSDEDKNAFNESKDGIYPDIILLRSRLLFDGGYLLNAEEMIKTHSQVFKTRYQQIEYYYRYGRIMQESSKVGRAIELYNRVISLSENDHLYFAPNSCLQLGFIYLKLGYKDLAKTYFEKALTYKNYEYHSGISQKANAALNELD